MRKLMHREKPTSAAVRPVPGEPLARRRGAKVCHVVATTEGATWMFEQLRELRDQFGYDVTAVVSGESGRLIDKLNSEHIPHYAFDFGFGSFRGMMRLPREVLRLARFFRQQRFDVVQTHVFVSMVLGRVAAWLADVPVRLAMISGPFHLEAHTSRWIDRATHWMESALIPSCEESVRLCRAMGVRAERLPLIYYSVDERKFDPEKPRPSSIRKEFGWDHDTPLIGMVSYFYPRLPKSRWIPSHLVGRAGKGHEDLINAAPLILAEFPTAKFLLVGNGWGEAGEAYLQELKKTVSDRGLEQSIIFTGYREDVNDLLREFDVGVQASLSENLGGTIEGLMMECPMVATRVGGMPDAVRDQETGILVNPADPADLARGILQHLRDPQKSRAMGVAGRKLMLDRFTLNRTVADLANLYDQLLANLSRRGYQRLVSVRRLVLAAPLFAYLSFRLLVLDLFIQHYLPAYLARGRGLIIRVYYVQIRIFYRVRYWVLWLLHRCLNLAVRILQWPAVLYQMLSLKRGRLDR